MRRYRRVIGLRLRSLFSGSTVDRELDDEVNFHLEQHGRQHRIRHER